MAIGGRAGASLRNSPRRPRPSSFSARRSCDGMVTPRVAARASATSSGVNCSKARSYTRLASDRSARHSIMFARSTAWRHGDGRASAKATDIGKRLIDEVVVDVGLTELHSAFQEAGYENVLTLRSYLDESEGLWRRDARVSHQAQHVILVLHEATDG